MNGKAIRFSCGNIGLEGVLHLPRETPAAGGVVVCHPHPLYGGDMDNNVVRAICAGLEDAGIGALRFNFRGVSDSQGSFADGVGEREDVTAAVSFLLGIKDLAEAPIGLCGYSFGAGVALCEARNDKRVRAVAAVSLQTASVDRCSDLRGPKLVVCGSRDLLTPAHEAGSFAQGLCEPKEFRIVPEADHFWLGHEQELAGIVVDFFLKAFQRRADPPSSGH